MGDMLDSEGGDKEGGGRGLLGCDVRGLRYRRYSLASSSSATLLALPFPFCPSFTLNSTLISSFVLMFWMTLNLGLPPSLRLARTLAWCRYFTVWTNLTQLLHVTVSPSPFTIRSARPNLCLTYNIERNNYESNFSIIIIINHCHFHPHIITFKFITVINIIIDS